MKKIIFRALLVLLSISLLVPSLSLPVNASDQLYTVSGTITAGGGTPLANILVFAQGIGSGGVNANVGTCTDGNGHYSLQVPPGVYRLNPQGTTQGANYPCEDEYTPSPGSKSPTDGILITGESQLYQGVAITTSDIIKDFTFPTIKLTIKALDSEGQPYVNRNAYTNQAALYESALVNGGSNSVFIGNTFLYSRLTNIDGEVSGYVIKGATYEPGTICVNPYPHPVMCNTATITITEDTVYTLSSRPLAPSGLTAHSPASDSVLQWNEVVGAESYNVYRNGAQIGTASTNGFTDGDAPEGLNTYEVTTVKGSGESARSASINVNVDRTLPEITHTTSKTANDNGWYDSDITVSFACSDSQSGIAVCSEPVSIGAEGAHQAVNGIATDNAGNSHGTSILINLDKTAPITSRPSMSSTVIPKNATVILGATTTDNLSGVAEGEYYIDKDPGTGSGTRMTYDNGKINASTTVSGLNTGQHKLYMRTVDKAGNWSAPVSVNFTYVPVSIAKTIQEYVSFLVRLIVGWFIKL